MPIQTLRSLLISHENPPSIEHAARTAIAAVLSLLIARLCTLPEAYWAAISTMIVMQSTLGAALPISVQRLAGTAIGALAGALVGSHFPENSLAFGIAVFVIGGICVVVKIERAAYRYAGITLAIVMLIPRAKSEWVTAAHRFLEVSIGIAVGLAVTALWPEQKRPQHN